MKKRLTWPRSVYQKLFRRSLWALGVSASLNIILIAFGVYEWQEGGGALLAPTNFFFEEISISKVTYQNSTLEDEVQQQFQLSFAQLISLFDDKTAVGDGYKKRDVALTVLTSFHHFHLEKALRGHLPKQTREIPISSKKVTFYPGLLDEHYSCLRDFAKTEKWPLTCQGLFLKLQEQKGQQLDASLCQAFMQTEEYHHLHSILVRGSDIQEEQLFAVLLEADWALISQISKQRQLPEEACREIRRSFLLSLMKTNRRLASETLVICDFHFALRLFDDLEAIFVLEGMQTRPELVKQFALGLLKSPRSDEVWQKASDVLCVLSNLDSQQYSREKLLEYFEVAPAEKKAGPVVLQKVEERGNEAPKEVAHKGILPKKMASEVVYIIQSGDSLWSISKKFHVDIATIKKHNQLQSDALKPGTSLRIPIP